MDRLGVITTGGWLSVIFAYLVLYYTDMLFLLLEDLRNFISAAEDFAN